MSKTQALLLALVMAGCSEPAALPSTQGWTPVFAQEPCNGFDDDNDGAVDEDCSCTAGATQKCYPSAQRELKGLCAFGKQVCQAGSGGEFGKWGPCENAVLPGRELCDGLDNDCDGKVDNDCDEKVDNEPPPCTKGETRPCTSVCGPGKETCDGNRWLACDAPAPNPEVCDGVDNDCDGVIDNGCACREGETRDCASACGPGKQACVGNQWLDCDAPVPATGPAWASVTPWEMHEGDGLVEFGYCTEQHGAIEEYDFAAIPSMSDPGWQSAPDPAIIGLARPSSLCGQLECRCGGDFTYFRTFVTVEAGATLSTFVINISGMDDGVRTTIFNSQNPEGITVEGAYVFLGGSATANLAPYIAVGETNTVVLTHVDDCCSLSNLNHAEVVVNGQTVQKCP